MSTRIKNKEIFIQISILTAVIIMGAFIYVFSASLNPSHKDDTTEEKLHIERTYPARFLLEKSSIKHTIKDRQVILEGSVFNLSETISYKNIVLKINLYNKESKLLNNQNLVIEKSITPKQTIEYTTKLDGVESVEYAAVSVLKADIM
jgi:hypothetical protein